MTESYTTLKGFNSISDTDIQSAIQQNLTSFFDWGFLDKGSFSNVRLVTTDIRAKNKSILSLVNDTNFTNGRVWSAFRENLVWESGVSCSTQPINISGVYVNNSFKTPTTSGYQHYVDYPNGRVVFDTAIATNSVVKMEYSYKNINFSTDAILPIIQEIQQKSYIIDSNFTVGSGDWNALNSEKVQLPIVTFEISPRTTFTPLELGNSCHILNNDVLVHVLSEDRDTCRKISNFISYQVDKVIWMFDPNLLAINNAFPLDYRGAKTANPKTYPSLVSSIEGGGYRYNKLVFKTVTLQGPNPVSTIYHSVVRFNIEVVSLI